MPHIEIKTSNTLLPERKKNLCKRLAESFAENSSVEVSKNIQFIVEDRCFIEFRGNSEEPSANVQIHPGFLTPEEDYEKIVEGFFPILVEELQIPQNKIYITISEIKFWGFDGVFIKPDEKS